MDHPNLYGIRYSHLLHLRELKNQGLTQQRLFDFHVHLKKFSTHNEQLDVFTHVFQDFSKEVYVKTVLLPSYSQPHKVESNIVYHYAAFQYYLIRFAPAAQEQIDFLNACSKEHRQLLIKEIIQRKDTHEYFYDYLKKSSQTDHIVLKKIVEHEENIGYLDLFKEEIVNAILNKKVKFGELGQFYKKTSLEKINYGLQNWMVSKDAIIGMLNLAFVSMPWKNVHSLSINHTIITLLKKDRNQHILDMDAFLLMTKRMVHCGWAPRLPLLFSHIKKHHDFFEEFKNTIFSRQQIKTNTQPSYTIDFDNNEINFHIKRFFLDYLEQEMPTKKSIKPRAKI